MDGDLEFQFKLYQNHFKQPLRTSHGIWRTREGIIISLTNQAGKTCQGEIAPLPWFGSETITDALKFCQQLEKSINQQKIIAIPDCLPCCQFAFESAFLALDQDPLEAQLQNLDFCYLLPAGEKALTAWQDLYQANSAITFKWKIGVLALAEEIKILQQLTADFPPKVKLRLDANGGLNLDQAQQLLDCTDNLEAIEFVEQPLSANYFPEIRQLSQEHRTLLALDESIASWQKLQQAYEQEWQGVYVIKAAILGFPTRLKRFCQQHNLDVVFSSVFETEVGKKTALQLAQQLNHTRAVGFGLEHWYHPD